MTIKEAIQILEDGAWWDECIVPPDSEAIANMHMAADIIISALHAQQEPVKLDRSRWKGCPFCWYGISRAERICAYTAEGSCEVPVRFCPSCGKPLTEKAWAEMEGRFSIG